MTTTLTRRNALQSGFGAAALAALAGCANQQQPGTPTTQPVPATQPTQEQQAYDIAFSIWTFLYQANSIAGPAIPVQYETGITAGLAIAKGVLDTWLANMGKGLSAELQAEFFAALPNLVNLLAQKKAAAAGTTPQAAALRAKALHR